MTDTERTPPPPYRDWPMTTDPLHTPAANRGPEPLSPEDEAGLRRAIVKATADDYHYSPRTVQMLLDTLDVARAEPRAEGLDVERLAQAMLRTFDVVFGPVAAAKAAAIAREYAALTPKEPTE